MSLVIDEDVITEMKSPEFQIFDFISRGDLHSLTSLLHQYPLSHRISNWDKQSPLHIACRGGNLEIVKRLLDLGADPNSVDKLGMSPLMEACSIGNLDIMKVLVDANAEIDAVTISRQTLLWFATLHGSPEAVRYLLDELKIDPNAAREDGVTPLMVASSQGFETIVDLLINAGADVNAMDLQNTTALINAAEHGSTMIVSLLLHYGAHVNIFTENNFTPLIISSAHGHLESVQKLVDAGATVDLDHPDGVTALMYASAAGHLDIVKYLISSGSNVNAVHSMGGTALLETTAAPHSSENTAHIVTALLDAGAGVDAVDNEGISPIISASAIGNEKVIRYSYYFLRSCLIMNRVLIDAGADLNQRSNSGMTALHYAIVAGHSTILETLLQAGANPNVGVLLVDNLSYETSTMIFAVENGNLEIVRSLVENIAENDLLHQCDAKGITPLVRSIQLRHLHLLEYLLSKNVNPNLSFLDEQVRKLFRGNLIYSRKSVIFLFLTPFFPKMLN